MTAITMATKTAIPMPIISLRESDGLAWLRVLEDGANGGVVRADTGT